MRPDTLVAAGLLAAALSTPVASARGEPSADLDRLFRQWHEWQLREHPEWAMSQGDYRYADRITDGSLQAIERRHAQTREFLERLRAISPESLGDADLLNRRLFELMLSDEVQGQRFPTWLAPIGGRFGPQQRIPQMAERVRFESTRDYDNYLARLEQVPLEVRNTIERLRLGIERGWTPPAVTLEGVPLQFRSILEGGLDALRKPLDAMGPHVSAARAGLLRNRFEQSALPAVRRAVAELGDFLTREYLPRCRIGIAARDLPDGEAFYAYQVRVMTTTEMSPREIHDLGRSEVARIRGEMLQVIRRSDFLERFPSTSESGDDRLFEAFIRYLRTDPRFYHVSPEALLAAYRDICKRVDPWLARLFGTLPRLPYGVREIPAFMAPDQTTAYYQPGDMRNAEPGWFYANTYALDQRPTYEMIPLALHEAVPGHHLQIALALELENQPEFRRHTEFTAFVEGWALYSERLGIKMGLYEDPYNDFGRLLYEMWRACRLVVDPGMHALGWSREKAIQFMLENTALSEHNIETEIDRYIAWPGQACAYKVGELRIRGLRERAERELKENFDLREFHDMVLGAGAIPLTVLQERAEAWIEARRVKAYD
jgi:uncharacterized protein (DUF885 family)